MLFTLLTALVLQTAPEPIKFEVVFDAQQRIHGSVLSRDGKALFVKGETDLSSINPIDGEVHWAIELNPLQVGHVIGDVKPALLAVTKDAVIVGSNVVSPSVRFYDAKDGKLGTNFGSIAMGKTASSIVADSMGRWVWFGLDDGTIARSTVANISAWSNRNLNTSSLICMTVEPKEKSIALGCKDGSVRFVGMSSASVDKKKVFEAKVGAITALAHSSNGKQIFVGGAGGEVAVITASKGASKSLLKGPESSVTDIVVHRNSKWAAVSYQDGSIYVFEVKKGEVLHKLTHPEAKYGVVDLELLNKGKTLLSVGGNTVVSWDIPK